MEEYLKQLNESQREAVVYTDGPSLVVAGAGSGKTRVLTYKIAYLLRQGLPPQSILALTFTNKAAREMKDRIASLTDERMVRRLWMGTFHSVFSRILRSEAECIGYPSNFTIYDATDSKSLLRSIMKEMQLDDKVYRPGLHFKIPFIQTVVYFDARILDYDARPAEALTSDLKSIVLDNYARWKIVDPLRFYRTMRTEHNAQARLDAVIYSQIRAHIGRHTLTQVVADERTSIMDSVTEKDSQPSTSLYFR